MNIIITLSLAAAAIAVTALLITRFFLRGRDLSAFDGDIPTTFDTPEPSAEMQGVNAYLSREFSAGESLKAKRKRFDAGGLSRDFPCSFVEQSAEFNGVTVPGEWTLVEGADPARRLLYLHGGAFTVGSPVSHRPITSNIAKRTGCVVFSADYRLMPENRRLASIEDSRASYQWLVENGPDGATTSSKIAIAGDSAGGNLTLSLANWLRDNRLRVPDAVIAISPATDSSITSPSIHANLETDIMLQPLVKPMLKVPHGLLLWMMWLANRIAPSSRLISPVRDDLSGLPPTLIHASTAEMLYDDAKRYVNKATSQGSPVTLQSWAHLCHVWHIFDDMLPEAHHALDEIANFMRAHGVAR